MHYAETHFKFRLPWSLLYRPWPEILTDAPFQFVPGKMPQLWIVVPDAHRLSVTIKSLEISIQRIDRDVPSEVRHFEHLDLQLTSPSTFSLSASAPWSQAFTRSCRKSLLSVAEKKSRSSVGISRA